LDVLALDYDRCYDRRSEMAQFPKGSTTSWKASQNQWHIHSASKADRRQYQHPSSHRIGLQWLSIMRNWVKYCEASRHLLAMDMFCIWNSTLAHRLFLKIRSIYPWLRTQMDENCQEREMW
jgi:hypothetical protein